MRLFLGFTLLFAALIFVDANPAYRKDPPAPEQIDEDDSNGLVIDNNEDDDVLLMKRQPYKNSKWAKSRDTDTVNIPYTISGVNTGVLQRAIEVFNQKTCIRFVARSSEANYVLFQSGSTCHALVGNQEIGSQTCDLTSSCSGRKGKVLHEMMHILSFLHEQCRPDRDSYVTVNTGNIKSGAEGNFVKIPESENLGIPYDCDSILHYRSEAFASPTGQKTITSTHCSHLGNGDTRLSLLDYKRVNTLYSCGKPTYKYYKVRVVTKTSGWSYAESGTGTDCYIYLTLHGSAATSTEFELDLSTNSEANLFESGSDDTFNYMAYRNDLGSITGISVRMVSNGNGAAWYPLTFTVTDPSPSSTSVTFTNSKWLSPSSTYGTSTFSLSK